MKAPFKRKRNRNEQNNPTVIIHDLLNELQTYIEAYEEVIFYIGKYPNEPIHKLPLRTLTHYAYTKERVRRETLTLKSSQQNRLNMQLTRMRLEEGARKRGTHSEINTNAVLDKVAETFQPLSVTEQALIHLGWPRNEATRIYKENPEGAAAIVEQHKLKPSAESKSIAEEEPYDPMADLKGANIKDLD